MSADGKTPVKSSTNEKAEGSAADSKRTDNAASEPVDVRIAKFVKQQKDLLELERQEELELESAVKGQLDLRVLEQKGLALSKLVVSDTRTGLYGRCLVTFAPSRQNVLLTGSDFGVRDVVEIVPSKSGGKKRGKGSKDDDDNDDDRTETASTSTAGGARTRSKKDESANSGVVYTLKENSITVSFEHEPSTSALKGQVALVKLGNEVTHARYMSALDSLNSYFSTTVSSTASADSMRSQSRPASRVLRVIFGLEQPVFAEQSLQQQQSQQAAKWRPMDNGLNHSQIAAIDRALNSQDVFLIHGPPGTGKTTTVVELIRQAVLRGERVLACAPSNIAVDNLAEKLAAAGSVKSVRVGHPARLLPAVLKQSLDSLVRTSGEAKVADGIREDMTALQKRLAGIGKGNSSNSRDRDSGSSGSSYSERKQMDRNERKQIRRQLDVLRKELKLRERKAVDEVVTGANVVLCTLTGAATRSVQSQSFDLVVIDEAAQALETACFIAIMRGSRCILAGDHKQLPPTIKSETAARKGLEVTLFDRLANRLGQQSTSMLTVQYRMHETIMKWSSDELYQSKLTAADSVRAHLLADLPHVTKTPNTTTPFVFIDTAGSFLEEDPTGDNDSKSNTAEAKLVVRHVTELIQAGLRAKEIAVITPYNAQVRLLQTMLHEHHSGVEVGTVDGFQGREKEAIVISMVRSNSERSVGFLKEDRRMNVAVTRARRHVCLIGDSSTVSSHPFLERLLDYAGEHADYRSIETATASPASASAAAAASRSTDVGDAKSTGNSADSAAAASSTELSAESVAALSARRKEERKRERALLAQAKEKAKAEQAKVASAAAAAEAKAAPTAANRTATASAPASAEEDEYSEAKIEQIIRDLKRQDRQALASASSATASSATASSETASFSFPPSLTSYQRMRVHAVAERLGGVSHNSHGEGAQRCIRLQVLREPPAAAVAASPAIQPTAADQTTAATAPTTAASASKPTSASSTSNGSGAGSKDSKDANNGGGQCKKAKKAKEKADKEKKAATAATAGQDEDLDSLLSEFRVGQCKSSGCKNSIKFVGFTCQYCKDSYCVDHMNPIFHGCAEAAKQKSRADMEAKVKKQIATMKSGSGTLAGDAPRQQRPLSEGQKNHLAQKLHDKATARQRELREANAKKAAEKDKKKNKK